ncbi:hypothetical protein [Novosphingobium sp. ST904]|uniref:hypothetical protein n=1 Tax=Novosphingobium sp. ST904 TaxID=1684385 RepID=UPI001E354ED7|nr:hypothetical protein [Novosphingobium sp. ST904]
MVLVDDDVADADAGPGAGPGDRARCRGFTDQRAAAHNVGGGDQYEAFVDDTGIDGIVIDADAPGGKEMISAQLSTSNKSSFRRLAIRDRRNLRSLGLPASTSERPSSSSGRTKRPIAASGLPLSAK